MAYEMLGSAADAEDVLQETWLRWSGVGLDAVRDPRAFLVRVTTREALTQLRTLRRRRESYVGPWLPEPLLTACDVAEDVELADSLSIAMMLVLHGLTMAVRSGAGARLSARTSSHPLPGARAQLPSWPGGARGSSGGSSCPGTSGAARSASVGHRSYLRGQRYEDHSIRFHQYHLADMGRVRVRKYCEIEDREVDQGEIGKGYQVTKEQVIPISDEELRELPLPTAKAIEIVAFVPLESVDPLKIGEGCYLAPSGQVAAKPYKLLRMALDRSSKVAVAKYAWSGRERLGLLRGREDVIVLHAMRWPDEIRSPEELLPPSLELTDEEIDGALALMDTMTGEDLEGEEFQDTYTEALAQINEAKREHREPP